MPVHSVTLEFPDQDAPLSWHLTRKQQEAVLDRWATCPKIQKARHQVWQFLNGVDAINCSCPTCNHS